MTLTTFPPVDGVRDVVENDAYAAMLSRMIGAYGRRLATGDVEDLTTAQILANQMVDAIAQAIVTARDDDPEGWSWSRIGRALGITKQAAQQRFGRPLLDAEGAPST